MSERQIVGGVFWRFFILAIAYLFVFAVVLPSHRRFTWKEYVRHGLNALDELSCPECRSWIEETYNEVVPVSAISRDRWQ